MQQFLICLALGIGGLFLGIRALIQGKTTYRAGSRDCVFKRDTPQYWGMTLAFLVAGTAGIIMAVQQYLVLVR